MPNVSKCQGKRADVVMGSSILTTASLVTTEIRSPKSADTVKKAARSALPFANSAPVKLLAAEMVLLIKMQGKYATTGTK